jgi:hypothetical protein
MCFTIQAALVIRGLFIRVFVIRGPIFEELPRITRKICIILDVSLNEKTNRKLAATSKILNNVEKKQFYK